MNRRHRAPGPAPPLPPLQSPACGLTRGPYTAVMAAHWAGVCSPSCARTAVLAAVATHAGRLPPLGTTDAPLVTGHWLAVFSPIGHPQQVPPAYISCLAPSPSDVSLTTPDKSAELPPSRAITLPAGRGFSCLGAHAGHTRAGDPARRPSTALSQRSCLAGETGGGVVCCLGCCSAAALVR